MATDDYANPDALVDANWIAEHLDDPSVRLIETGAQRAIYDAGHIPGAIHLDWRTDLQHRLIRDFLGREDFEALMASLGITNETTVVFYSDAPNACTCYACWLFALYGHPDCRVLNGGRSQWIAAGHDLSREDPKFAPGVYHARPADLAIRAFRDQVLAQIYASAPLIDARSPEEFSGEANQSEEMAPELAPRNGHIPSALNVPWTETMRADGTFRSAGELRSIFLERGIRPEQPIITYSRVGERSAQIWFVLARLLGYPDVRNYDGSWTEWGSLVRAPIEREENNAS